MASEAEMASGGVGGGVAVSPDKRRRQLAFLVGEAVFSLFEGFMHLRGTWVHDHIAIRRAARAFARADDVATAAAALAAEMEACDVE